MYLYSNIFQPLVICCHKSETAISGLCLCKKSFRPHHDTQRPHIGIRMSTMYHLVTCVSHFSQACMTAINASVCAHTGRAVVQHGQTLTLYIKLFKTDCVYYGNCHTTIKHVTLLVWYTQKLNRNTHTRSIHKIACRVKIESIFELNGESTRERIPPNMEQFRCEIAI